MKLTEDQKQAVRTVTDMLIDGTFGEGFLSLSYSKKLVFTIERFDSHALLEITQGKAELSVPVAPDPDLLSVRFMRDKIGVTFAFGTVWLETV